MKAVLALFSVSMDEGCTFLTVPTECYRAYDQVTSKVFQAIFFKTGKAVLCTMLSQIDRAGENTPFSFKIC